MKFIVFASALNGEDQVLAFIDGLIDRLADQVHRVEVPEADLLQESSWYQAARSTRRKVLTSALANPPRRSSSGLGPHVKKVEITDFQSAQQAHKLAHTPLVILVEDREADGVMLEILVEEVGWPTLRKLWTHGQGVTPRAFEINSAGGIGSIPQRVARAADDAVKQGRPARLFVLCDSDARWPGDEQKSVAKVKERCSSQGVPHHIWKKRSLENYLPDEVLEAVRDDPRNQNHRHRYDALLRRSRIQRDHFPINSGLKPTERREAIDAGLYDADTEMVDLELLEDPLFPRRSRPLLLLHRERRAAFTAASLRRRDGTGEIEKMLRAIAEEL